ncbi:hypothetical protein PHISCL_05795 [Aspergillus sclerotialis]|uniref:Uncharacterized protein n=1 Tax=Aspergillus sclerotialis TaxID=2070753 RepID=A0A3A2ZKF6_9EURO|nr:hypothetical protein PHISCL_05795 [Aspergillus sclerotialis]
MDSTDKNDEDLHSELPISEPNKQNEPNEEKSSSQSAEDPLQSTSELAEEIQHYDWDQLFEKYADVMEEHARADELVRNQTAQLHEAFVSWSQSTALRDETRALKRFKTQRQYVENSEEDLEGKRQHYIEVVNAFESALALLNGSTKP